MIKFEGEKNGRKCKGETMQSYKQKKDAARQASIQLLEQLSNGPASWFDMAEVGAYLETIGRRFGLIKEFKENGIL